MTSVAQKTAAKATKVAAKAEDKVEDAAETTKATAEKAVEAPKLGRQAGHGQAATVKAAPRPRRPPRPPSKAPAKATSARVTRARTAKPAEPDRGARQEELTSPTSDHRPGPRSCDAALRGPVASAAGLSLGPRPRARRVPGSRAVGGYALPHGSFDGLVFTVLYWAPWR